MLLRYRLDGNYCLSEATEIVASADGKNLYFKLTSGQEYNLTGLSRTGNKLYKLNSPILIDLDDAFGVDDVMLYVRT